MATEKEQLVVLERDLKAANKEYKTLLDRKAESQKSDDLGAMENSTNDYAKAVAKAKVFGLLFFHRLTFHAHRLDD